MHGSHDFAKIEAEIDRCTDRTQFIVENMHHYVLDLKLEVGLESVRRPTACGRLVLAAHARARNPQPGAALKLPQWPLLHGRLLA